MSIFKGTNEPSGNWESFVGLWERANLIRAFFWSQKFTDEKVLLTHLLARLRRFFAVDFCYGALTSDDQQLVEVGQPEAGIGQLPEHFSRRCMDLVANASAPVTWHSDVSAGFGYRSAVVAPLTPPAGRSFGFLMLGHGRRKSYSSHELFLLQSLAVELSWVVRDLAASKQRQQRLAAVSHEVKNSLQVVVGNTGLIEQQLREPLRDQCAKQVEGIASAVQQIIDGMNELTGLPGSAEVVPGAAENAVEEASVEIASAISQSVASCRNAARERGVDVEVVYASDSPRNGMRVPAMFKRVLDALVDHAAAATRNESVRLTVRREADDLAVVVRGMESNRVADRLKSLFEPAAGSESARDHGLDRFAQVRSYLNNAGGDVYFKSRPGEAAEFIVYLPIDHNGRPGRAKLRN